MPGTPGLFLIIIIVFYILYILLYSIIFLNIFILDLPGVPGIKDEIPGMTNWSNPALSRHFPAVNLKILDITVFKNPALNQ